MRRPRQASVYGNSTQRQIELWSSEHCRALFGVSSNHALSTSAILETVHPEDRQLAVASIRAATFGNLSDASSEFRIIGDNGGLRWLQARAQTTLDEKGKPARVSGIFRDITSYKAAQQEAEELSRRVMTIQDAERQRIAQELHELDCTTHSGSQPQPDGIERRESRKELQDIRRYRRVTSRGVARTSHVHIPVKSPGVGSRWSKRNARSIHRWLPTTDRFVRDP